MSAAYRMGLAPSLPADRSDIDGARWSLVAHDPSTPMRSGSFAASDGQAIPYRLWPAREPRALVLLLHGALDYSGAFDELGPQLARHRLSALAIDQRGFGATSTRGKWGGHNRMIRDVIEAVLFLRMRYGCDLPLFILGESMGAAVAVHSAARVPDLDLAGLVLASPGAVSGLWRRIVGNLLTRVFGVCLPNGGFRIERVSAWDHAPSAAIRLLSDPMVLRQIRPATLLGLLTLSLSAIEEARRVHVPVLTMVGERDDVLRIECIRRLHDGLAGEKQWAYFADAPHLLLHWKDNDRVIRRVFGWVDDHLNRTVRLTATAS
ncbi:MAG TPA: alpha/beta fold hydrolase [Rhizomicrobium sp.]|jgi:alpha-beta hydrolase superfamily lysophospholipase